MPGQAGELRRLGQRITGHRHRPVLQERRPAQASMEHPFLQQLAGGGVDGRDDGLVPGEHPDGDREEGQVVHEVGGAVQRVEHPQKVRIFPYKVLAFLSQDAVAGIVPVDRGPKVLLRLPVRRGHRIVMALGLGLYLERRLEMVVQYLSRAAGVLHRLFFQFLEKCGSGYRGCRTSVHTLIIADIAATGGPATVFSEDTEARGSFTGTLWNVAAGRYACAELPSLGWPLRQELAETRKSLGRSRK